MTFHSYSRVVKNSQLHEKSFYVNYVASGKKKGADSQEETIKCVVDHHHAPFEQIQTIGIGFLCL